MIEETRPPVRPCIKCGATERYWSKGRWAGCKRCHAASGRARFEKDPEKKRTQARAHYRRNRAELVAKQTERRFGKHRATVLASQRTAWLRMAYGLSREDYARMLAEQGGMCAICKATEPGGRSANFHIDHCHTTGKIRGLLCCRCNQGLGAFRDNVEILKAATEYLQERS